MIKAVFQHHLAFLAVAIAVTVAVGMVVFLLTRRRTGSTKAMLNGLWASSAVGPAILTSWSGSGVMTYTCAVNPDVTQALQSAQGHLNLVLFIPYGLFAALATRRPLFAAATGVLFTAAIETAQATMPFISRLCDTDDLITNSLGACIGAALGALVARRLPNNGTGTPRPNVRRTLAWVTPAVVLIAVGWLAAIDPVHVQPPAAEVPSATAAQTAAINDAVTEAFPSASQPSNAFYTDNGDGTASVTASLPGGFAELSWPDREQFTAHFTPASNGEGTQAYRIPGISHPVTTPNQAKEVATAYADRYAPWAKPDAEITVRAIDDKVNVGWMVEWRRWKNDVLMPMRLSIGIEPSGVLIDLIARNVADPHLPPAKINEAKAWEIFDQHHKLKPGQETRQQPIYLAQRRNGQWRIHWLLSMRDGNALYSATVDATDASIHNPATAPVEDGSPLQ
ncbi:VanZ family protein [Streptomyces sp. NPDC127166]|uniref:VanZ family protein n=1 Tax=Streptomyces sp. NPDC127166 TaxID=3345380 RepID=UPI003633873A